jgi:hypothetical protein
VQRSVFVHRLVDTGHRTNRNLGRADGGRDSRVRAADVKRAARDVNTTMASVDEALEIGALLDE